jgi:ABC-type Zn uptake system ZnuABC Zn-binding protein ZnuA
LKVVATFSVLGDFVRVIGGEHVDLTVLAGPGLDTHTFVPTAADAAALADASVIIENGLGFETWLDNLYVSSGSQATRTVASAGINPLAGVGEEAGEDDPHIWHSVPNAIVMVRNVRDALAQADPANAATYQANADAYVGELEKLDDWVKAEVSALPPERRVLVTTHDTFAYFAERYGFTVLGTILPTSTEGASPSAQQLAELVDKLKAADVPAVFAENVSPNSLLNQVATEAGVQVVATLYTDALGPEGSTGATYLEMMRSNVTNIVQALGG